MLWAPRSGTEAVWKLLRQARTGKPKLVVSEQAQVSQVQHKPSQPKPISLPGDNKV